MTTEWHSVSVEPDGSVSCSCDNLRAQAHLFGGRQATAIGHAHIANPSLPLFDLLNFVDLRPA